MHHSRTPRKSASAQPVPSMVTVMLCGAGAAKHHCDHAGHRLGRNTLPGGATVMHGATPPNNPTGTSRRSESGDTLIEVLLAIVILGIAEQLALLVGFATALTSSRKHRQLATLDASVGL